ncbi:MAG: hypothetical protein ABI818_19895 [Acidobacteriota bacterium]
MVVILFLALAAGMPGPAATQDKSDLAGQWTLNRAVSQFPAEIGFNVDFAPLGGSGPGADGPGGRRGSRGAAVPAIRRRPESEDDARRVQLLTGEVRTPSAHLTIVDTPAAVTVTDEKGRSRTFHPNGKEESLQLDTVPVGVTATREAGRLTVRYRVEEGRELRYTYSRAASPPQLVVSVQFVERGNNGDVRWVYEPATAADTLAASAAAINRAAVSPGAGTPGSAGPLQAASTGAAPAQTFNQQPDAELRGIKKLGVVVEELSSQAAACGLSQSTLETAVSKRLTDAGLTVIRNSDQDTYVYVNVITSSVSNGLCVSRYDAFLYTYTTATLSYQTAPVLVQVSLLHKGSIAGGSPAAHADGVVRGVQDYVDLFVTRIRDANK